MEQFKRAKVVMLPTEESKGDFSKERIYPCILKHSWMFDDNQKGKLTFVDCNIRTPTQLQHLYITSDDEIKEGDWYYTPSKRSIEQCIKQLLIIKDSINDIVQLKIIATTDKSLTIKSEKAGENSWYNPLPQPSNRFIQSYIESYNKGNIITDVNVTYEEYILQHINKAQENLIRPKINSKDNTISTHRIKNNYTEEEVVQLMFKFADENALLSNKEELDTFDNWCKANFG